MKHNSWALSAIRDLQELTNESGLTSVSEALEEVYSVAIAELNDTAQFLEADEDAPMPCTANNVVRLRPCASRAPALHQPT